MNERPPAEWEAAARAAADQLFGMVVVPKDIVIKSVAADGANGTNALDSVFIAKLTVCEHLDDRFLSDK